MKNKNSKKTSMVRRIVIFFMIALFFQAIFFFYTIVVTNIANTVESYSYNTFTRTATNRRTNLESFMSLGWSNIKETSTGTTAHYINVAGDKGTLTEDEKATFLIECVPTLVQMISMAGTTGGFIILDDGEDMQYSYSTLYLKGDYLQSQASNYENLMLARGPTEVSKEFDFSLSSNWSYGIKLTEETYPILSLPVEASQHTTNLEYLGYWHISNDITNDKNRTLTYSMPFFDADENPIGVVGIEVSQEYLYRLLPEDEFSDYGSYGYILAEVPDNNINNSFLPSMSNGTLQNKLVPLGQMIETHDLFLDNHDLDENCRYFQVDDTKVCVYYEPLQLYVNNSPFDDHKLWLVAMVNNDNMTSFTNQFWSAILSALGFSLLIGVIISIFIGKVVARPILKASKVISSYDVTQKINFEQSNIKEIDELSSVIELMQENILRSANRTDKILELLDIGVGSFEFVKGTDTVSISEAIYKMLNLEDYVGKPIPKDVFLKHLKQLKQTPIQEVKNTYAVGKIPITYYKVEEFEQDDVLLGVIEDITDDVEDLLVLNYERNYDLLTGIYNRRAFHQGVYEALREADLKVAGFIMFDLDNLKYVNDTFGHDSGDVYIKTAGTTIHTVFHKHGIVGRMSGDEFYAFLYGFDDKESLMAILNELYDRFKREPIEMPNATDFNIQISGGIAWYNDDSCDIEELKKYADFAMYTGKHSTKGVLREFDKQLYLKESSLLSGNDELNRILDNELLQFVYQPIIDIKTKKIHGYEALMRPMSDVLATPVKLLQIASVEGELQRVEKIVLEKTLSLFKKHKELLKDSKLFINSITSEQLQKEEYIELNEKYGDILPNVVVEIIEQENLDDTLIQEKLQKLSLLNTSIALDDYGSGDTSAIGLTKLKPNIIKIDRSLISNVHVDPSRQKNVNKIISFCKENNIKALAEGIETEQELEYLILSGIELVQGYYISRPLELPTFDPSDLITKISEIKTD